MAVDGCGMKCVKGLLFAFNFIFFICGGALLGVGIYVQLELRDYFDFFSAPVNAPAFVIIAVGAITLIVGFLGCCGARREHKCMIMTFAVLIGIILIIEVGGGIAGFVLRGKVNEIVTKGMEDAMSNYNKKDGVKATWDTVQKKLGCCGTEGPGDWNSTYNNYTVPMSCCKDVKTCEDKPVYFPDGCLPKIEKLLKDNVGYVAGTAVGLAVVEVVGIILACCLFQTLKRQSTYA